MKIIHGLKSDIINPLNEYKDWVLSRVTQDNIQKLGIIRAGEKPVPGTESDLCSRGRLMATDHDKHRGPPVEQYGINLNYNGAIEKQAQRIPPEFFADIRARNNQLDDELQYALGARFCALKMFYPANGYIGWHTNWDLPGYNVIFTFSPSGKGFWRHIDSSHARSIVPDPEKLVHIDDVPGWHCKSGYFGPKSEPSRVVWHSAYAAEPRVTISYVLQEESIWKDVIAELSNAP